MTASRSVTEGDIVSFAEFSGDFGAYHLDPAAAAGGLYGRPILHGAATFSICTGLLVQAGFFEGADAVAFLGANLEWRDAVMPGDTLRVEVTDAEQRASASHPALLVVTIYFECLNQDRSAVLVGEWMSLQRGPLRRFEARVA